MARAGDLLLKDGVFKYGGANVPGWVCNLGMTYAAGTLTITDAQGNPLSVTNPGFVTVPSTTAGQYVTLKVTAPASFNDDANASGDLTNLGFGITETVNWAQDVPFFIYVINRANSDLDGADGSSVFALARSPCMHTSPSSSNDIGDTGAIPSNDSQNVILIMDDITIANYTSLPMQVFASLRMQWATGTTEWTVQTLGNTDGFGQVQLEKQFSRMWTMPAGQNGATSGKYFVNNGGTAPVFTNNNYSYRINPDGMVDIYFNFNGDGGTDGAGAVTMQMATPYASAMTYDITFGTAKVENASEQKLCNLHIGASAALIQFRVHTDTAGSLDSNTTFAGNDFFPNGARDIPGSGKYRAY